MSSRLRRFTLVFVSILVTLAILGGLAGNAAIKASFPQISGELKLAGLNAPVEVYRDKMGIPHIYASNLHDLFMAQGFVHAQDRFWQMDFWRHIGSGRLSEMFGKSQVETDMFLRTLGWRQVAEQEYQEISPDSQAILNYYADGVNAYLKDRSGTQLSLEYGVLGLLTPSYKPEPWTPIHTLTWGKAMAWDLGGNMDDEIERSILLKTLTPAQLAELYPAYPADYPVIVEKIGGMTQVGQPLRSDNLPTGSVVNPKAASALQPSAHLQTIVSKLTLMEDLLGPTGSDIGSNSWVASGKLTSTGKPLLANDMHLGVQMPSIWYQNSLHCQPKSADCNFDVTGFSFVGVPGIVAGHNNHIAWAFTNLGPDVQDLFIEKINPDNPDQYEVDGKWVNFETRPETIAVGGSDPVKITVRITRHGPVVSDTYGSLKDQLDPKKEKPKAYAQVSGAGKSANSSFDPANLTPQPYKDRTGVDLPEKYVISLAWTALSPASPFPALWGFDRAQNWEEFRTAARNWSVPAQNLLYADVDGNIGYQAPGNIPIRKQGDGSLPVPGWTGEYDWGGFIPFEELPYSYNPESGFIATANNQASPRDYPKLITTEWDYGQRAARIVDMLKNAPAKIDMAYIQSMHGDAKSLNAEALVPVLLSIKLAPDQAATRDKYFASWDYQERADSVSASLFEAFWWGLLTDTFSDDLPQEAWPAGGSRWYEVMRNLIQQPNSPWWDDKTTTDRVETRDDMFAKAFAEALTCQICTDKLGKDISKWQWGQLHTVTFRNGTLGKSGVAPIEALFNRGPYVTGGGKSIVNATGWTVGDSFEVNWHPSEREIVDLSNLNNSISIITPGQSGHAYSAHYADMAPLWAEVKYAPMWWEQDSIIKDAEGHLTLKP